MNPNISSKTALLSQIDQLSFVVTEWNLYLDTHPEDENALHHFHKALALRKQALQNYAEKYGPLTIDTANDGQSHSWQWVLQPWPWEFQRKGGC